MNFVTEPGDTQDDRAFIESFGLREATTTLLEVSIAALTTEPELQNIGRSLIRLARYHEHKTVGSL